MSADGGRNDRLGGERWNRLLDEIVQRYGDQKKRLGEALMTDGYPPFTQPVSPREQYQKLLAMQASGDPAYWNDPAAQAALAKLAARYGPPSPLTQEPYGGPLPNSPAQQVSLTQQSAKLGMPQGIGG